MTISLLATLAALLGLALPAARAQEGEPSHVPARSFQIPFTVPHDPNVQEYQLWVWQAGGWVFQARAFPGAQSFDVRVNNDGLYTFADRIIYKNGTSTPASTDQLQPKRRVMVDTEKPLINLLALPLNADGVAGVKWEVRDDNLDITSLRLDYRDSAQQPWQNLPLDHTPPRATDQGSWRLGPGRRMEVRLTVKDMAGNTAERAVVIGEGGGFDAGASFPRSGSDAAFGAPAGKSEPLYVNTKRIKLEFTIEGIGPSGLDPKEQFKLYVFTPRDRRWQPVEQAIRSLDGSSANPTGGTPNSVKAHMEFTAPSEGLYGFTVVPKSGVGFSGPEPRAGEEPNKWVEVDETKPQVEVLDVQLSPNPSVRAVTIRWRATDKNFGPTPIILEHGPSANGPWTLIEGNLPNSGVYTWSVPEAGPHKFFLRVRAVDRAANMGEAVSREVIVDLSRPRATITNAEPAGTSGGYPSRIPP